MVHIVNGCRGALTAMQGALHTENIDLLRVMEPARVNRSEKAQNTAVNAQLYLLNEMILLKISECFGQTEAARQRGNLWAFCARNAPDLTHFSVG